MLTPHPALTQGRSVLSQSSIDRTNAPTLSVVIPTYNEAKNIQQLMARLVPILDAQNITYEIILVDDGSVDDTCTRISSYIGKVDGLKLVRFSRNFGKEAALNAGLAHAAGDAVMQLDADLQHPPEIIPDFIGKWRDGADIVYGARKSRSGESFLRRTLAKSFYSVFATISQVKLMEGLGDFLLIDRKVVDALLLLPERERFTKGLYAWVGFSRVAVPFEVAPRAHGQSRWSIAKLTNFAMDAITAFGSLPLKVWTYVGLFLAIPSVAFGVFIMLRTLILGSDVPGYASLMVAICLFSGVQLLGLGIIGEYLSRVLTEVKQRPLYLVQEKLGFDTLEEENHPTGKVRKIAS
ncbi:MAG: glycosyltransferase family 2 protein [Pseudomonadota bacterium]